MHATFALRWNYGDPEVVEYWIIEEDQEWHELVRGDGASYSPGGPRPIHAEPSETRESLTARAKAAAQAWAKEHGYV